MIFITFVTNSIISWLIFKYITEEILLNYLINSKFKYIHPEGITILLTYTFSIIPLFLNELFLNITAIPTTQIRPQLYRRLPHFLDYTELGRSAIYLRFPVRTDIQKLLVQYDDYYFEKTGKVRKRRFDRNIKSISRKQFNVRKTKSLGDLPNNLNWNKTNFI